MSAMPTAASIAPFTFRAACGQITVQRMHEMHCFASTRFGSCSSMAPTGHAFAHRPQPTQSFVGFGTMPAPPPFLYGRFPGMCGAAVSPAASFFRMASANDVSVFASCASGRPRRELVRDRMLRNRGRRGENRKARGLRGVLELDERVLIRAVAVDAQKHGPLRRCP